MSSVNFLMKLYMWDAFRFQLQTKNPLITQRKVLCDIIQRNKSTVFGKKHNFSTIKSIADFQREVPVNTYEKLRPYVRRMLKGEDNVLVKDRTVFYAITSGTTNRPKFIPVTVLTRGKKSVVINLWVYYMTEDHPTMFRGKTLVIVSPAIEGYTKTGIPYGSESGDAYRRIPWIVRKHYLLPYEVFCIEDYESRYYTILRLGLASDVTNLAAMNPLTILVLCQKLEVYARDIIEDIRNGTLKNSLKMNAVIRAKIAKNLKPDPKRALFLENLLKEKGRLLPRDFWPNLALIECWKGGSAGLYLDELSQYFSAKIKVRDFGYLATEARCSIPRSDRGCAGILTIGTNFYEFIAEEEKDSSSPRYLTVDELKKDKRYFILFTTHGGLYRYDIGDIVCVTGFYNKTPLIEFVQKGQNVSSVTGEKLYESQVTRAMEIAKDATGFSIEFFCCLLNLKMPPRYSFLVEFIEEPDTSGKRFFLKKIEDNLQKINIEYKAKRHSQRLGDPVLLVLSKGSFDRYRKAKLGLIPHDGQFKFSHLKSDFKIPQECEVKEEIALE